MWSLIRTLWVRSQMRIQFGRSWQEGLSFEVMDELNMSKLAPSPRLYLGCQEHRPLLCLFVSIGGPLHELRPKPTIEITFSIPTIVSARTKMATTIAEHQAMEGITSHGTDTQQRNVTLQSPARTPTRSPVKKPMMITEAQKQALIDNLQLEGQKDPHSLPDLSSQHLSHRTRAKASRPVCITGAKSEDSL